MVAAELMTPHDEHVLTVADTFTAAQKFQRSFAQELLIPWADIEEHVATNGTDDDSVRDLAAQYQISERVITSALVNKGHLSREALAAI